MQRQMENELNAEWKLGPLHATVLRLRRWEGCVCVGARAQELGIRVWDFALWVLAIP